MALEGKIVNPLPLLSETKSVLQSICDHAQAQGLHWSNIDPPTAFEAKVTFFDKTEKAPSGMTITTSLGTLDRQLHKYHLNEHEKAKFAPVMVTILDDAPEEMWVTTFWSKKATEIAGDRIKDLMNCQKRVLQDRRPRPRHSERVGHLLPNLRNPGYFWDKDGKQVFTQDGSWDGRTLTADETRFVFQLISTSWAQTHGMSVQQPLALMLSLKFCVPLPSEVGAALSTSEKERHDKALQQRRKDTASRWLVDQETPDPRRSLSSDTGASSSAQQWLTRPPQPTPQHAIQELTDLEKRGGSVVEHLSQLPDSSGDEHECQYRSPYKYKGSYQ